MSCYDLPDVDVFNALNHIKTTCNKEIDIMYSLEKSEDTKGIIRSRKSLENRQHNGQKKTDKHLFTKYYTEN